MNGSKMMLRSRNQNVATNGAAAAAPGKSELPTKRAAAKQIQEKGSGSDKENASGEPKAKRVLSELRNQISTGLVIGTRKFSSSSSGNNAGGSGGGRGGARRVSPSTKEKEAAAAALAVVHEHSTNKSAEDAEAEMMMEQQEVEMDMEEEEEEEIDPCPGYDYDKENEMDEFQVPEFARDIFKYYRTREHVFKCGGYVERHTQINKDNRAVLVDWMIEMQETFELNHETLYLAVKLLDIYLTKTTKQVKRNDLQLLACAAVFIASKYDERQPPLLDDFLYMAEDNFTKEQLLEMEMEMLRTVNFDLGAPLSYRYLRRYAKTTKTDMKTLTLARFVLETSLMFYEFVPASEAKMAAGAFLLALRMLDATAEWTPVMVKYSGLSPAEVEPWCWELLHMLHVRIEERPANARLVTAFNKYSHEVFFEVAKTALPTDRCSGRPIVLPE